MALVALLISSRNECYILGATDGDVPIPVAPRACASTPTSTTLPLQTGKRWRSRMHARWRAAMGEIADMMLDGTLCQECGEYMDGDSGYPRTCGACSGRHRRSGGTSRPTVAPEGGRAKIECQTCGKRLVPAGLKDHQRDKHGTSALSGRGNQ